jgi:Subtilase family
MGKNKDIRRLVLALLAPLALGAGCDDRATRVAAGDVEVSHRAQSLLGGGVLFVVGSTDLSASDLQVRARLQSLGLTVEVRDDDASTAADATGRLLVAISESAESEKVGQKFRSTAVPVVSWEPAGWDDLGMAPPFSAWNTSIGDASGQDSLDVLANYGPLSTGLRGHVAVTSAGQKFVWAKPTSPQAIRVATAVGDPTRVAVFGYREGAAMEGGFVAPHRRVAFFAGRDAPAAFNAMGWRLFDAAVTWSIERAPAHGALMVVGSVPLSASDAAVRARLSAMGFAVTVTTASSARGEDANGMKLVVISESVTSSDLGSTFRDVSAPIVLSEPALLDEMRMVPAAAVWNTDAGDAVGASHVSVVEPSHPLAAGLRDSVAVAAPAAKLVWGRPTSTGALVIARVSGDPAKAAIFGFERGSAMEAGFTAPHRRVFAFPGRDTPASFTTEGWRLFEAAISWASAPHALLVVGAGVAPASDSLLANRLTGMGFLVTQMNADSCTAEVAEGVSLVVISESSPSSDVGDGFTESRVPVLTLEPALQDDLGMVAGEWQVTHGELAAGTRLFVNRGNALSAGLADEMSVSTAAITMGWGMPNVNAVRGAVDILNPARAAIYSFPAGVEMASRRAPAARTLFFATRNAPSVFTPETWRLFDAAVLFTVGGRRPAPIVLATAGQSAPVPSYDSAIPIVSGPDASERYSYAIFRDPVTREERAQIEALGCRFGNLVTSSDDLEVHQLTHLTDVNTLAAAIQQSQSSFHGLVPFGLRDKLVRSSDPVIRDGRTEVTVNCGSHVSPAACLADVSVFVKPINDAHGGYIVGEVPIAQLEALARIGSVNHVLERSVPHAALKEARVASQVDAAQAFTSFPILSSQALSGGGVLIGIYDSGIDPKHPAFHVPGSSTLRQEPGKDWYPPKNVFETLPKTTPVYEDHGTHVAGIAAGGGQHPTDTSFDQRGVAPAATLFSAKSGHNGPLEHGNVVNHSHINDRLGLYNQADADHDAALHQPSTYKDGFHKTVVIAAGNQGYENAMHGPEKGFYSILNNAKNPIIVGNYDDALGIVNETSSQGPTRDGRIKPDLMAPGTEIVSTVFSSTDYTVAMAAPMFYDTKMGTSMAAPHVSGIAALMHQIARDRHLACGGSNDVCAGYSGDALRNATIKAILIQTATDLVHEESAANALKKPRNLDVGSVEGKESYAFYGPGPDFSTGWGLVNAKAATDFVKARRYSEHIALSEGETRRYRFLVSDSSPLRVTAAWDDAPAAPLQVNRSNPPSAQAARRLVNDLDIYLIDPNGNPHYPWRLQPFLDNPFTSSSGDDPISLQKLRDTRATRAAASSTVMAEANFDHLNNVERIDVDAPTSGSWTLVVVGRKIAKQQDFSLSHPGLILEQDPLRISYRVRTTNNEVTPWVFGTETAGDVSGDTQLSGLRFETRGLGARNPDIRGRVKLLTPAGESPWQAFVVDGGEMVDYFHTYFPITRLEFVVNNPHPLFDSKHYEIQYRVFQKGLGWSGWGCGGSTAGAEAVPISAVQINLLVGTSPPGCP